MASRPFSQVLVEIEKREPQPQDNCNTNNTLRRRKKVSKHNVKLIDPVQVSWCHLR